MKINHKRLIGCILCLTSMLSIVGCSQSIDEALREQRVEIHDYNCMNENTAYEVDTHIKKVTQEIVEKIDRYHQNPNSLGHVNYDSHSQGALTLKIDSEALMKPDPSIEEILTQIDEEIMPGMVAFIEEVNQEKEDFNPKSKVFGRGIVITYPEGLREKVNQGYYTGDYHSAQLTIRVQPAIVKDTYTKELLNGLPKGLFTLSNMTQTEDKKLVEISTPSYLFPQATTVGEGESMQIYESKNAVNYQLFTEGDQLEKIRMIIRKNSTDQVNEHYLEPLYNWGQEAFKMSKEERVQLQAVVDELQDNSMKEGQGQIGTYRYHYKGIAEQEYYPYTRTVQFIELVIEKKN